MIPATEGDIPAIEAFLRVHIATSMFPLVNLRDHGMAGGHARAVTCWVKWSSGQITDVLALTDEGVVFPQCPTGPWGDVAVILTGRMVKGVLGAADQVTALRQTIGLTQKADLDTKEPLFALPLADLVMPDVSGFVLRPLSAVPRDFVERWRADYSIEALAVPGVDAAEQAAKDIVGYLEQDSHRLLLKEGEPVAMTGFNAMLPETVQIGGVYTPPAHRSQGFARRAVALHLAEARVKGVKEAILFAANAPAARAYEAIGFRRIGSFAIALNADPQVIHG
ncbi:GNAT family N-acetyltransferase [Yoonia sp. 2307UL14-13]|uniref:GNAT family N-acetyltransferase n=1 Tax=Yoonia sp. 2307UL14-13 TaxID=3126506 RepID=UPI00309B2818